MSSTIVSSKKAEQNLVYLYLAEVNQCSRYTYLFALNKVARKFGALDAYSFDWVKLRNEHTTVIKRWLLETGKATSAHKILAAVKGILEKAFDLDLISADDYLRAIKPCKVKVNKQLRASTGRMLETWEIDALLETCKKGGPARSSRDAAIISIFYQAGTRLAEVSSLNFADYIPNYTPDVGRLIIHGKGSKDRTAYIKNGTLKALNKWIEFRGTKPGPLFYTILKADQPFPRRVCPTCISQMLGARGRHAKLSHFTPHDLRRTFASRLLGEGVDISTVADLMGHTDPSITKGYDRRGETRKMDAIA
jgi:integrase